MKHININKIIYIVIMTVLILSSLLSYCKATVIVDPNYDITESAPEPEVINAAGVILGAIRIFGTIISVLILAIIGLEYIMSSPEGKADYKKNMYPYIIGAILLFAGTNLVQFIYTAIH